MIDTFMAVWNRYHRKQGVKLLLTWLLIGISLLSLSIMAGLTSQGSFLHHARRNIVLHNRKGIVTVTALNRHERGDSVTATTGNGKAHMTLPCVVTAVRKRSTMPASRASTVPRVHIPPRPVRVPASPTPSSTPTTTPIVTPIATDSSVATPTEDVPTPEPTDEDTPIWEPTDIILLPPEKTVIVLITPTTFTGATSTPTLVAWPTVGDDSPTTIPGFEDAETGHAIHVQRQNAGVKTSEKTANSRGFVVMGSAVNCFSDSVNMAIDSGNIGELILNAAIILGSILPIAILFYSILCAVYVFKIKKKE